MYCPKCGFNLNDDNGVEVWPKCGAQLGERKKKKEKEAKVEKKKSGMKYAVAAAAVLGAGILLLNSHFIELTSETPVEESEPELGLRTVTVPYTNIENFTFLNETDIGEVEINDQTWRIGVGTFLGCANLGDA